MRCSLGNHEVDEGCFITEPRYIRFVKRVFFEFRPQSMVCSRCRKSVIYMYNKKVKNLRQKLRSINVESTNTDDSITNLVQQKPLYQTLRSLQAPRKNGSNSSNNKSDNASRKSSSLDTLGRLAESDSLPLDDIVSNKKSRDPPVADRPSTSAEAYKRRTANSNNNTHRTNNERSSSTAASVVVNTDDLSSEDGINVLNGSRLPNVQPVPRRRQFINDNPDIMDIYLQGITGG